MRVLSPIIKIFFCFVLMTSTKVFASDMISTDNGTDKNGDMIVAPTLALRCGLSSQSPDITSDCIDRLAYDRKSGTLVNSEFANYEEERLAILSEYASEYLKNSLKQMVLASGEEDKINEKMCIDSSKPSCSSASKDIREEIEYNNKLAANNAAIMMEALKLRAQGVNYDSVETILNQTVHERKVDLSKKSLMGPP